MIVSNLCVIVALAIASTSAHVADHMHGHPLRQLEFARSVSMAMTSSMSMSMSSTSYECPVCGMPTTVMGNHIVFKNGQKAFSCSMEAHSFEAYDFKVTDVSYLAANAAEFIVNVTDTSAYTKCENSCDECADGIKDPVTGDVITTTNFQYVCLNNGQKIYFASVTSKNKYLQNVNSAPRYLVDSVICGSETCSDATKITTLSPAAQAFVPDLTSSSSSGSTSSSGSSGAVTMNTQSTLAFALAGVLTIVTAMF